MLLVRHCDILLNWVSLFIFFIIFPNLKHGNESSSEAVIFSHVLITVAGMSTNKAAAVQMPCHHLGSNPEEWESRRMEGRGNAPFSLPHSVIFIARGEVIPSVGAVGGAGRVVSSRTCLHWFLLMLWTSQPRLLPIDGVSRDVKVKRIFPELAWWC